MPPVSNSTSPVAPGINQATTARESSRAQVSTSQARNGSSLTRMASMYGIISSEMAEVERRISAELQSPYESLGEVLRHGTQLGGKRLRPALVLLSGKAVGEVTEEHLVMATVLEMVHTATLVHDDVLDSADRRRHVSTINAKWNTDTSILLGDYLFSQAFRLAANLSSTVACQVVGEAARQVCEGELRQILNRGVWDLDEETYLDMLRGKTAELLRAACEIGALQSTSVPEHAEALKRFGTALGIAFQLADDFLDLWGTDETVGKTLGTDIEQGKATLPVLRMLGQLDERSRKVALGILQGPPERRVDELRPWLEKTDAREYTESVTRRFWRNSHAALQELPESDAREALKAIADFAIDRQF
ncbi:MAG: polyprenyl synthetase family protein [Planctomycetota bacterium]